MCGRAVYSRGEHSSRARPTWVGCRLTSAVHNDFTSMTKFTSDVKLGASKKSMVIAKPNKATQANEPSSSVLRYKGSKHFRQRLVVAV